MNFRCTCFSQVKKLVEKKKDDLRRHEQLVKSTKYEQDTVHLILALCKTSLEFEFLISGVCRGQHNVFPKIILKINCAGLHKTIANRIILLS